MDMLGMGVTVVLRDLFTSRMPAIRNASSVLSTSVEKDAQRMNQSWKLMGVGAAGMLGGGAILGSLFAIGKMAVEKAADLEVFQRQFISMTQSTEIGNRLFKETAKFAAETPFQIPEVMQASKMLMAYGFQWHEVGKELRVAGDWAALMNVNIKETADIIGRVKSGGYSTALRYLRSHGVNPMLLKEYGAPLDAKMKLKPGADPQQIVDAMNKLITNDPRFKGQMDNFMKTIPGMVSNMADIMTLAMAGAGNRLKETIKGVFIAVQTELSQGGLDALFGAFGAGLDVLARMLIVILAPLGKFIKWVNELSKEHPNFVKWGVTALGVGAALLFLGGAVLTVVAAYRLLSLVIPSAQFMSIWTGFVSVLPLILTIAGIVIFLAAVFNVNFLKVGDASMSLFTKLKLIFGGVFQLIASLKNGIGTMSLEMADKLRSAGLLDTTISLFMAFYRLYQVGAGIVAGFSMVVRVLAMVGSVVFWLLSPVWGLIYLLGKAFGLFTDVGNAAHPNKWKAIGIAIGTVVGAVYALWLITKLYNISVIACNGLMAIWTALSNFAAIKLALLSGATKIATAAQWLLNIAMDANPIGIVILLIGLLIMSIVLLATKHEELAGKFKGMPGWAKDILALTMPFAYVTMMIMTHWDRLKLYFKEFALIFKIIWDGLIMYVLNSIQNMIAPLFALLKVIPDLALPPELKMLKEMGLEGTMNVIKGAVTNSGVGKDAGEGGAGIFGGRLDALLKSDEAQQQNRLALLEGFKNQMDKSVSEGLAKATFTNETKLDGQVIAKTVSRYQKAENANGAQ